MTTIDFPTFRQAQDRRLHMDDVRAVVNALSDPVIELPHEFTPYGLSIQVRDAENRCQIEGALVDYGFSFGEDSTFVASDITYLRRPILRGERQVGRLYGEASYFASTPALLDELVDNPQPLSDMATVALLDAIRGDVAEWVEVDERDEEDDGEGICDELPHMVRWRAQAMGGLREFVEPVL